MVVGPAHVLAQLAASIAFADKGAANSRIFLYADAGASTGAAPSGSPMAEIELAKPCATLSGSALTLNVASPEGSLVLANAIPKSAQWVNGEGALVAAGTVTDASGDGDFTVSGGVTAAGETSPNLYAGGLVLLGAVVLD